MSAALTEHLRDLFAPPRPSVGTRDVRRTRPVLDRMIIGVIIDEVLYPKADEQTRGDFQAAGCAPCIYRMKERPLPMSCWSLPDDAMDSPQAMRS